MARTSTKVLPPAQLAALRSRLYTPRYEILPLRNAIEQVAHLEEGATITVTASPTKGMGATVDLAVELAREGFPVVPHISARLISDRRELSRIVSRLDAAGLNRVFVVGGDVDVPGEFFDGAELLAALEDIGHGFDEIGIPGYPEGHHIVDDETARRALLTKVPHASYITTQMCFSPASITRWVERLRTDGVDIPVNIGVPGVSELGKLLKVAARIGVGDSRRFLSKNRSLAGKLVRPGGYGPDELLIGLAETMADPAANLGDLHIYTFNQVEGTERWRRQMLESLA